MDTPQFLVLLADAGMGVGIAVGISSGLVTGMLFGLAGGASFASKKIGRQLTAAIESGDISVVGKDNKSMTADSIVELLNEKFDKA